MGKKVDEKWMNKKSSKLGPLASYVLVSPDNVRIVPDELLDEEAVFLLTLSLLLIVSG